MTIERYADDMITTVAVQFNREHIRSVNSDAIHWQASNGWNDLYRPTRGHW